MTTQLNGTDEEPEPVKKFRGEGWYNVWRLLLAVFIGLVCACIYWIVRAVFFGEAIARQFGYELFFAVVLGVLLMGRWTVPRMILDSPSIDERAAGLTKRYRFWWPRGRDRR